MGTALKGSSGSLFPLKISPSSPPSIEKGDKRFHVRDISLEAVSIPLNFIFLCPGTFEWALHQLEYTMVKEYELRVTVTAWVTFRAPENI